MTRTMRTPAVTIRLAQRTDGSQLQRVAQLDSAAVPTGELLVAEADGRLLAAVSLADSRTITDPFTPTADLVELLLARAAQLHRIDESTRPRGRLVPRMDRLRHALALLAAGSLAAVPGPRS